jgi:hypothetical protein
MRLIHFCSIALFLFSIGTLASARDIPRTDPDRKAILDAVRRSPEIQFVVKDLYRSGDFAWLCAVETVNGVMRRTDEGDPGPELHAFVLLHDKGAWVYSESMFGGFLSAAEKADCTFTVEQVADLAGPPASERDLKAVWQFVVHERLLDDLKWGHWGKSLDDGVRSTIAMLKAHGIAEDFVIDDKTGKYLKPDQQLFDIAMEQCKDAHCRKATSQAAADLPRLYDDSRVSSLVWDNCQYGRRMGRVDLIANCVDTHRLKPYCRPGMRYFQDKEDIQHCLGDIAQQCRSLPFADDVQRSTVCFYLL